MTGITVVDRVEEGPGIAQGINTFCTKLSETDRRTVHIPQRSDGRKG